MVNIINHNSYLLKNEEGKLSMMSFDALGNIVWNHGINPQCYPP